MPLKNSQFPICIECHGNHWQIGDERSLASLVARLLIGQYRHVQRILTDSDEHSVLSLEGTALDNLIKKLQPNTETERYHRDGWLFQMITWIAAKIVEPGIMSAPPQPQSSMPGFDNLFIRVDGTRVAQVVVGEDKATQNDRETIREQVWPELRDFETGRRDFQLLNEITPILERAQDSIDVDECIKQIFWDKVRSYRVCIPVESDERASQRTKIFKGYKDIVQGDLSRRQADTFALGNLRLWMDSLSSTIVSILRGENV